MPNQQAYSMASILDSCKRSTDFVTTPLSTGKESFSFSYYKTLIDVEGLGHLLHALQTAAQTEEIGDLRGLLAHVPMDGLETDPDPERVREQIFKGCLLVYRDSDPEGPCALIPVPAKKGLRSSNETDMEFSVVGPKIGFIEDLDTNIHLLRAQLNTPDLVLKEILVGSISRSRVALMYIDGVANEENVAKMEKRLRAIDFDVVFDTSQLDQIISDNSRTPFPLFTTTERRDRVVYALITGQVAVISEGSPYFITGPSTLFDFFLSPEDYFLPWILGSFFRMIRIFGVIFSLFASSFYVALMTYHYEVIPKELLGRLIYSRENVPFAPFLEALFLEITVEFLREAGARLPSRIGQSLGIVGGIILGQAAVEASLTSNILIIIVSLSALTSFVTPIYKMSNAIRFLRFPIILLAAVWGSLGIAIAVCFLLVHLSRLRSLGYPYTVPFFPVRVKDMKDSLIRPSYAVTGTRPSYLKPRSRIRYKPEAERKSNDFDEE
ncbi:spore germination protein [Cohnella sp. JJ-181]|uniref:spore germination protein n=1 Tax=Cohnella rhizoplanae TaxID=2974897 RepID=UPI0022FF735D|nr:spore germination protein [Cohnella sp. JJ-181]CAI6085932.1 Spore germination protein A1 [Cohnella sp. JJ-181]